MKNILKTLALSSLFYLCFSLVSEGYIGYYSYPDIKNGIIAFNTQDNLWTVSEEGGMAKRITANPVSRAMVKISPSGEYIAYSAMVDGNMNVFAMPVNGGIPKKLTFHPSSDQVLGWTRDSRHVLFRSSRQEANYESNIFRVSIDGGYPELINIGAASLISFSEDEDFAAFNTTSREFRTWKRYKGGTNMDIWAGRLSKMDFRKLTNFRGNDAFPMVYMDRIYFISDRKGRNNIYSMSLEGEDLRQHTFYTDFDINFPSLGNGKIVFQMAGDIYIYDIGKDKSWKVDIEIPAENMSGITRYVNADRWIGDFRLSPDSKTACFEARGNLFLVPVKEGRTKAIIQDSSFRIKSPEFSNDGKKIAYFSDETGNELLYYSDIRDNAERKVLIKDLSGWHYPPLWSPDDSKIIFADEKYALYLYDIKAGRLSLVDRSPLSEIREYSWSPDSRYISYSKTEENTFSSIFLYSIEDKQVYRITDSTTNDHSPDWDPEGRYLYFLSARQFSPTIGNLDFQTIMTEMEKPYMVLLNKVEKNPLLPLEPEEQEEQSFFGKMPGFAKGDKSFEFDKEKSSKPETKVQVKFDAEGIRNRIFELPVPAGNYHGLTAVKDKVFFLSGEDYKMNPDRDFMDFGRYSYKIISFDLKEREHKEFAKGVSGYHISAKKDKMIYRVNGMYKVVSLDFPSFGGSDHMDGFGDLMGGMSQFSKRFRDEFVDISNINLAVNPQQEWMQIFNEAVRLQKLLYWAEDLAGIDWDAIASSYRELLPRISTRNELNFLIGELIGELATGHTYIFGGDTGMRYENVSTGLIGADIEVSNGLYRIKKILDGDIFYRKVFSPLSIFSEIKEGDYILSINGLPVTAEDNIYQHLENLGGREILLTLSRSGDGKDAEEYKIKTLSSEGYLRYIDWVNSNRDYVEKASEGRIGYIHLPDMSAPGMVEFNKQYYNQLDKEGLIVDVRYNGGGFVSQLIIERLNRELIFLDYMRHGKRMETYPHRTFLGHMVCLINENAGSDGDIFPEAFKKSGLGPLIGTTTWGGVIGIRMDKPFVDGGLMSIPEYAHYDPERGWTLENIGVDPDIEVVNRPQDRAAGLDPQLEKGIDVLRQKIMESPVALPEIKPFPNKSMEKWIEYWEKLGVETP